jgi:hypothetical protein
MNDALTLGPAAAEEWAKGLEARGKQRMKAAEVWERWSVKNKDTKPAALVTRSPAAAPRKPSRSPKRQTVSPIIHAPVPAKPASKYSPDVSLLSCVAAVSDVAPIPLRCPT